MYKILVVDDEPILSFALRSLTNWHAKGFDLSIDARDGREALEILATQSFDIVLTDIKMPVMDGLELLRNLRELHPEISAIVLSAHDDFESVRNAFKLGAVDYIVKTEMDIDQLFEVFSAAITNKTRGHVPTQYTNVSSTDNFSFQLSSAISYIRSNYSKELNLKTVGDYCGLSEGHLSKLFMRELGKSYVDFVNCLRVEEAEKLLATTNLKIYQVAGFTGFNSAEHFCRVFKKVTGNSPNHYKNRQGN